MGKKHQRRSWRRRRNIQQFRNYGDGGSYQQCAPRKCAKCGQTCVEWPCRLCAVRKEKQRDPRDLLFDVDESAEFGLRGEDALRKLELPAKIPPAEGAA